MSNMKSHSILLRVFIVLFYIVSNISVASCSNIDSNSSEDSEHFRTIVPSTDIEECKNFINYGLKYRFNDAWIIDISTKPKTEQAFDEAEVSFSDRKITIKIADRNESYEILKVEYYKSTNSDYKVACLLISKDGVKCKAKFWIGGAGPLFKVSQGFIMYHPQKSVESYYQNSDNPLDKFLNESHYVFKFFEE